MFYSHKVGSSRIKGFTPKLCSVNRKVPWVRPPWCPFFSFLPPQCGFKPPSSNRKPDPVQDPTIGRIRSWICRVMPRQRDYQSPSPMLLNFAPPSTHEISCLLCANESLFLEGMGPNAICKRGKNYSRSLHRDATPSLRDRDQAQAAPQHSSRAQRPCFLGDDPPIQLLFPFVVRLRRSLATLVFSAPSYQSPHLI